MRVVGVLCVFFSFMLMAEIDNRVILDEFALQGFTRSKVLHNGRQKDIISSVKINHLSVYNNSEIRIGWQIPDEVKDQVKGFRILRAKNREQDFKTIKKDELANSRSIRDWHLENKTTYRYKLVTILTNGQEFVSKEKKVFFKGATGPEAVNGLKGVFLVHEEKPSVKLSWKKPAKKDIAGYVLWNDEIEAGKLLEDGSLPLITETEIIYPLSNQIGGREFEFAIEALNKLRIGGNLAKVKVMVPVLNLPSVDTPIVKLLENGLLQVSWNYELLTGFTGFQVTVNNKQLLTANEIGPDVRSCIIDNYPDLDSGNLNIRVQAVSPYDIGDGFLANFYLDRSRPDRKLLAPVEVNIQKTGELGGYTRLKLNWKHANGVQDLVAGYLVSVYAEDDPEYILQIGSTMAQENKCELNYTIAQRFNNKTLIFKVQAFGKNRLEGFPVIKSWKP